MAPPCYGTLAQAANSARARHKLSVKETKLVHYQLGWRPSVGLSRQEPGVWMMSAVELLHRHFETLVANPLQWQSLVDDEVLWELPFAPALGHPARLTGRAEVVRHATWFVGAVENFRFFDLQVYPNADPDQAVAEVRAEGVIKETGRLYQQEYIVFLRSKGGRILSLREYFDPTRAAAALDVPLIALSGTAPTIKTAKRAGAKSDQFAERASAC